MILVQGIYLPVWYNNEQKNGFLLKLHLKYKLQDAADRFPSRGLGGEGKGILWINL